MQRTVLDALVSLRPSSMPETVDGTFEGVVWYDERPLPTKEEVDAELERLNNLVPQSATRAQMVRVLYQVGKLADVRAAIAQADAFTQELWLSPTFERTDPVLLAVAEAVGLTGQLDDLFRLSATM